MYKLKSIATLAALAMLSVGAFTQSVDAASPVIATTTSAHAANYHSASSQPIDYYSVRPSSVWYTNKLASTRIVDNDEGFYAVHKWLGKVNLASRSGNRVFLEDGRWFYLKSFKEINI